MVPAHTQDTVMITGEVVDIEKKDKTPKGWHRHWQKEMDAASKRLKQFRTDGSHVTELYIDEETNQTEYLVSRLNLFYTNTSTLQSMLYGSQPNIDVSREFADPDDDVARVAANIFQRMLQGHGDTEVMAEPLKQALQDRLLPGLGVCRVRYEYESAEIEVEVETENVEMEASEEVTNEDAPIDYVHWQDFCWGWSRTWKETPWIAFRSWLTKPEVKARFGDDISRNLEYKNQNPVSDEDNGTSFGRDMEDSVQKAEIWEIWDKKTQNVFWWSDGADLLLDMKKDPLELKGFWPIPRPLMANLTTMAYIPRADYMMHRDLYRETDVLYGRIVMITRAVKVVGVYDKNAGDSVGRMLDEGIENDLIPVDNWAMFGEKGGLQGAIDWFPVQEVVGTLTTLRQLLSENIELLSQTTGLSNLLSGGNTDQYTSDGTNQLTAKFGSIRVQALQDEFARFASDLAALKAEVISKHFSPESIIKQSNAQFLPKADHDKIMPALQLMKSPDLEWRIDIRPESLAMIDYAQLKQERTEFLTAMATYIQSAQAAVKAIPDSLPVLLEMLKWGMAGFKGSDVLEGTMDQAIEMAQNAPPGGEKGKEESAAQQAQLAIIQAQSQAELQKIQAKSQADMQVAQSKIQGELQKIQMDNQATLQEQQQKSQADLQKIAVDLQADLKVIAAKLDSDVVREQTQSTMADAEHAASHGYNVTEDALNHKYNMDEIEEQGEQVRSEEDE
jgi:hypothetical protein